MVTALEESKKTSSIDSSFPVELPEDVDLFLPQGEFETKVSRVFKELLSQKRVEKDAADNQKEFEMLNVTSKPGQSFVDALKAGTAEPIRSRVEMDLATRNKMLTDNLDVTYKSTTSPLLDLFTELEKVVDGDRLFELLEASWSENPLATLKLVWNARSIHLGKGEQDSFYKCLSWMKNDHPVTVLQNLQWLYRGVIEKKVKKDEDAIVLVEKDLDDDLDNPDVLHGVSHGYWKDLLNILVLAASNALSASADVHDVLHKPNVKPRLEKRKFDSLEQSKAAGLEAKQRAKDEKHNLEHARHQNVLSRLQDPFYRYLHNTVARLFAQQLKTDRALLDSGTKEDKAKISLVAKWAPSLEGFHDKHTIIASSIAEALFPRDRYPEEDSRETYLKKAREAYRAQFISPLRRELDVVERKISAEAFEVINYSKVPSIAMNNYKDLFAKKDLEHYAKYIERVAAGKSKISGAVLTPATLIQQVRSSDYSRSTTTAEGLVKAKVAELMMKTIDGQWASLIQRIKDNGTLSSTMAVCDVSGSMMSPNFPDGTVPLDSSLGLSLLIAEVTAEPFGGCMITFSENPTTHAVGGLKDKRSLSGKINSMMNVGWGMNTDFTAVFERLILPIAIKNKVKAEEMVKQVIVFSDMQFDSAQGGNDNKHGSNFWESSFDRIQRKYKEAGYEMPRLIFWNLAGGRSGGTAPKPVTKDEENCLIVSGYSQAMLKMFLDNGSFNEANEEEMEIEEVNVDEEGEVETKTVKKKPDPMSGLWKAIGHKAYDMLKVFD